jgi:iron(III) transport system substrate-binding protein
MAVVSISKQAERDIVDNVRRTIIVVAGALLVAVSLTACSGSDNTLTVYSGRSEELVAPLIEQFEAESGLDVEVRYGESASLAATILEEGEDSPADVFFAQDPGSLGTVAGAGLFRELPVDVVAPVPPRFRDRDNRWIGVSGRSRVFVYDETRIDADQLPASEDELTSDEWAGRVALAPTNGSFLSFVAAKIILDGEEATLAWLEAMEANGSPTYEGNLPIVAAVDAGEVDAGLVNHYYLLRLIDEGGDVNAVNHFMDGTTAGSLVMPAGAGILVGGGEDASTQFIEFLLSEEAQAFFADETFEYPLVEGVEPYPGLPPIDSIATPDIDLSSLADVLDRATDLVAQAGLL